MLDQRRSLDWEEALLDATFPLGTAQMLWMIVIGAGLILAALLIWNLGTKYAPILITFSENVPLPLQSTSRAVQLQGFWVKKGDPC